MTECFFGDKDIFAAEARSGENLEWKAFGHFRVWVRGIYIGDFEITALSSAGSYIDLLETHPTLEVDDSVWLLPFSEADKIFNEICQGEFHSKHIKVLATGRYGFGRVMPGDAFDYCSQLVYLDSDDCVNFVWFAQEYWFDQDPDYPKGMIHKKVNIDYFDKVMKELEAYLLKSDDFLYYA